MAGNITYTHTPFCPPPPPLPNGVPRAIFFYDDVNWDYRCRLCGNPGTFATEDHIKTSKHQGRLAQWEYYLDRSYHPDPMDLEAWVGSTNRYCQAATRPARPTQPAPRPPQAPAAEEPHVTSPLEAAVASPLWWATAEPHAHMAAPVAPAPTPPSVDPRPPAGPQGLDPRPPTGPLAGPPAVQSGPTAQSTWTSSGPTAQSAPAPPGLEPPAGPQGLDSRPPAGPPAGPPAAQPSTWSGPMAQSSASSSQPTHIQATWTTCDCNSRVAALEQLVRQLSARVTSLEEELITKNWAR